MIHFKCQFQKDKAVFLLHPEILYLAEGLFLIPVQPGLCTQIQINPCQFQFIVMKGFILITLKDF